MVWPTGAHSQCPHTYSLLRTTKTTESEEKRGHIATASFAPSYLNPLQYTCFVMMIAALVRWSLLLVELGFLWSLFYIISSFLILSRTRIRSLTFTSIEFSFTQRFFSFSAVILGWLCLELLLDLLFSDELVGVLNKISVNMGSFSLFLSLRWCVWLRETLGVQPFLPPFSFSTYLSAVSFYASRGAFAMLVVFRFHTDIFLSDYLFHKIIALFESGD